MRKLFKFELDYGRMGFVDGLFIAEETDVQNAMGKEVYFGEILGKYSEVYCELDSSNVRAISDDQEKIEWIRSLVGFDTISGYNPLEYIYKEESEDE